MEAKSPTDRILNCPVSNDNGVYTATFQPDEAGEWKISVTYEGEHIQGSPFTCFVFDPHAVKVNLFAIISIINISHLRSISTRLNLDWVNAQNKLKSNLLSIAFYEIQSLRYEYSEIFSLFYYVS